MGVFIYGAKLGELLQATQQRDDKFEETLCRKDIEYTFIKKYGNVELLTEFKEGYYRLEETSDMSLSLTYTNYDLFLTYLMKLDAEDDDEYVPMFFYGVFSDIMNLGIENIADYKVAERILKDFNDYYEKAQIKLDENEFFLYKKFIVILKYVVDNKGVIIVK